MEIIEGVIIFSAVCIMLGVGVSIISSMATEAVVEVSEHKYTPDTKVPLGYPETRLQLKNRTYVDCDLQRASDSIMEAHCTGGYEISGINMNTTEEYYERPDFGFWYNQNTLTIDTACKHTYKGGILTIRLNGAESNTPGFVYINELKRGDSSLAWNKPRILTTDCPEIENKIQNQININKEVRASYAILTIIVVVIAAVIVLSVIRSFDLI